MRYENYFPSGSPRRGRFWLVLMGLVCLAAPFLIAATPARVDTDEAGRARFAKRLTERGGCRTLSSGDPCEGCIPVYAMYEPPHYTTTVTVLGGHTTTTSSNGAGHTQTTHTMTGSGTAIIFDALGLPVPVAVEECDQIIVNEGGEGDFVAIVYCTRAE